MRSSSSSFSRERDQNVVSQVEDLADLTACRASEVTRQAEEKRVRLEKTALHADRANRRMGVTRPKRGKKDVCTEAEVA